MMKILECKKLNIGYKDRVVCKDITFTINKGEFVCLIGENGSGKSSLLKTILGINKPLSGKVNFDNEFNKKHIGYLPQSADFQKDFPATVKEVVLSGFIGRMGYRPFYNRGEKEKANKLLVELGVSECANKSYRDLSGGQQQRVLLARALCATDNLLVMDEPTNGLDARAIKKFYDLVHKLNVENGLTIIMVSHNIDKVVKHATNIIYLKDTLQFAGKKEDFLASEHAKLFKLGE